jgi:hypothetical protein
MRLSMHRLPFAVVPCVALLLVGSLRADQEDLDTLMMRATVKVNHEMSTGAGFILCRPDPHEPSVHEEVGNAEQSSYYSDVAADGGLGPALQRKP